MSGGELLLTTGLILPTSRIGWEGYVSRLKSIGIAALGIGLGPRYSEPPDALVEACRASGLSLLIVPDPTPFLRCPRPTGRHVPAHLRSTFRTRSPRIGRSSTRLPRLIRRPRCFDGWRGPWTGGRPVSRPQGSSIRFIPPAWSRRRRPSSPRLSVWRSPVSTQPRRSSRGRYGHLWSRRPWWATWPSARRSTCPRRTAGLCSPQWRC